MARDVAESSPQIQFGVFTVDVRAGELRKQGLRIKLQERPFQLLLALLEQPGEVVTRDELRQRLWGEGTYVDFDHSISSAVNKLRAALNDSASHPRYVETVGRRGYRFLADVKRTAVNPSSAEVQVAVPVQRPPGGRRWWMLALIAALIILSGGTYLWMRQPREARAPARALVAVLPFENLTGDAAQDYLSDGVTEEMITQLGRLGQQSLGVVALRTSVMHLPENQEQLEQTARDLGAQYLLRGSLRSGPDKLRISVHLVRTADRTQLWAQEYDRQPHDLLEVQGEIAQEVAGEIQTALGRRVSAPGVASQIQSQPRYEAYDLYLRGRYLWNKRSVESFPRARESFEQAIQKDPSYARAYAGLADTLTLLGTYDIEPDKDVIPKARAAALKALELDPNLAEAHTSLALILEMEDWNWAEAEREFRRAIELDPNYATAHQWYGEFLGFQGRFDEGLAESERARQLDPLSLIIAADRCATLYFARRYREAIAQCKAVHQMEPTFGRGYLMVDAYAQNGDMPAALAAIQGYMKNGGVVRWALSWEITTYAHFHRTREALRALHALEQLMRGSKEDATSQLAKAYAALGDADRAMVLLAREGQENPTSLMGLNVDPIYDPIRSDERFQQLLQKMHFTQ